MKKTLKFFSPLLVFVVLSGAVAFWYMSSMKNAVRVEIPKVIKVGYTYDKYYAAVTGYTNEVDDISLDDLKKTNVLVAKEDEENVSTSLCHSEATKNPGLDPSCARDDKIETRNDTKEIITDIIADHSKIAIIPWDKVDFRVKTLSVDGKYLWDKKTKDYPLKVSVKTGNKDELNKKFDQSKITLLTNVGDVILGRHVAYKMRTYGDYTHPWLKMADLLKGADLTFADLETPLSDRVSPPDEGMSFITPRKSIDGLKLAGVDVVALANNHSTNYGTEAFLDTLELLSANNIKYVGGGKDLNEAESTLYHEVNGLKFAFLDYNSIIGAINATDDSAGVAKFDIKPWAKADSAQDIEKIKNAVKTAKKNADIVVVELHWGVEYEAKPIQSQIDVAHAVVDAGADLIVGTHPHVVCGLEEYKSVPIFYSLGNFIFDQEWSTETKQGTVAQTYFYGKKLVSAPLIPYQIEDYNQPHIATAEQAKQIFGRIFGASLSPEFWSSSR